MAVRNFWCEALIDGRETKLCGGPRAKDGEMVIKLFQREQGKIVEAFRIVCREHDGVLTSTVLCKADETLEPIQYESDR